MVSVIAVINMDEPPENKDRIAFASLDIYSHKEGERLACFKAAQKQIASFPGNASAPNENGPDGCPYAAEDRNVRPEFA
jgi:hypothetical protein